MFDGVNHNVSALEFDRGDGTFLQLSPGVYNRAALAAIATGVADTNGDTLGDFFVLPGGQTGTGTITVAPIVMDDADFDDDGDVDGRDFLIWQRGFGTGATNATGDANGSGTVNGADLTIWQNQYSGGTLAATTAVPEPGTISLVGILTALAIVRRAPRFQ